MHLNDTYQTFLVTVDQCFPTALSFNLNYPSQKQLKLGLRSSSHENSWQPFLLIIHNTTEIDAADKKTVYLHLDFQWANELCDTETLLWTYTDVWEIIEELQTLELTLRSSRSPIMIWEGFLLRLLLCTFPLEERVTVKCILSGNDLLLDCLIWMKMMRPMHQPSSLWEICCDVKRLYIDFSCNIYKFV